MSLDDRHDYELRESLIKVDRELQQYQLDAHAHINLDRFSEEEEDE